MTTDVMKGEVKLLMKWLDPRFRRTTEFTMMIKHETTKCGKDRHPVAEI
jgi:hypothetical protein